MMDDQMHNFLRNLSTISFLTVLSIPLLFVFVSIASIFLSGCATNYPKETQTQSEQEADADYSTGQSSDRDLSDALQKAAPVIDCAFSPYRLRFADCDLMENK